MKRVISSAAAVLLFAVVGCKSDANNKISETHLTSATQATPQEPRKDDVPPPDPKTNDVAGAPVMFEADQIVITPQDRERAAHAAEAGQANEKAQKGGTRAKATNTAKHLEPGDPGFTGGVAPGHIMWPPGNATGTGAPSSDGSHNIGAGGTP